MVRLIDKLELDRCPHCNIDNPNLSKQFDCKTNAVDGTRLRRWGVYGCSRCGGLVTAYSNDKNNHVIEIYPSTNEVDGSIPDPARNYLNQAMNSLHAPAGAVMLSASAVDAMLKTKGYKEGTLYTRIDQAGKDHLITDDMAKWAHAVRLDANDQRHADVNASLPEPEDARRCVDFVLALGTILFTLPEKINKGIEEVEQNSDSE